MFNNKILKGKSVSYKKLNYATFANGINSDIDEFILPINRSTKTYNFNFSNGALTTGLGIKTLQLPKNLDALEFRDVVLPDNKQAKAIWVYKYIQKNTNYFANMLVVQTTDGNFIFEPIYLAVNYFQPINNLHFEEIPNAINYNINSYDSLIFSNTEALKIWMFQNFEFGELTTVENAPKIESMCVHYERIFATVGGTKQEVWFSKELDPTNWNINLNDGGFIVLNDEYGGCNKVISFNDYVYVFRDFGINRITAYANQTEFNVSRLFVSSGQIYSKTICACGDRIIMLTENGLYAFDGSSTIKLNLSINNLLDKSVNKNANAIYHNGKYYLACHIKFEDEKYDQEESIYFNNVLFELDIKTNTISMLRGIDIRQMCVIADDKISKLVATTYNFLTSKYNFGEISNCGEIFGTPTTKLWESPLSDLGYPEKNKTLTDIYVTTKTPLKIKVRTEKSCNIIEISPENDIAHIKTCIKGKKIAVDFMSTQKECYISNPTIVVGLS